MEQEVVVSRSNDVKRAADELCNKLKRDTKSYHAVIFMAAISYDFEELSQELKSRFPNSEVIGTSTAGEISPDGFLNDTVVLTTMYAPESKVRGVLVQDGSKYPVGSRADIERALQYCGIQRNSPQSGRNAFAIAFINGVYNAEETILSNFYSIIGNDAFPLAGGTAGFTGNTPKTFVSYNGQITQDGAVMLFVKTTCKFDIRQEDIFNPTGKRVVVTSSNPINRTISTLNGKPAQTVYAQQLGVSESQAANMTFENPFGRYLNGALHIAALSGFTPDKKIGLFARVVPNSTLEMMHIGDPKQKADETCNGIKSVIARPKFTLLMTCITRTMAFERMRIGSDIISKYRATFPTFCGFSCYGEQIGRIHCNQTLVSVVIGD